MARADLRGLLLRHRNFSREEYEKKVEELSRKAGSRFARGNLITKNGRFLTPEALESEREALRQKLKRSA